MKKRRQMQYRKIKYSTIAALCILAAVQCGCGKKEEPDAASQGVMEITVAPQITPTPEPSQISSEAIAANGNLMMINGYLAEKLGPSESSEPQEGENQSGEPQDTGDTEAGDGSGDVPEE